MMKDESEWRHDYSRATDCITSADWSRLEATAVRQGFITLKLWAQTSGKVNHPLILIIHISLQTQYITGDKGLAVAWSGANKEFPRIL